MATPAVRAYENQYIDGAWVPSTNSPRSLEVTNSNTGKVVTTVPAGSAEDARRAVAAARDAFEGWSALPQGKRKDYLWRFLMAWQSKIPLVIESLMQELGCTRKFATEVQSQMLNWHLHTLLETVDGFQWATAAGRCVVVKEPIGVVGCITPWNYPLNQISVKIFPALMAGCTVVLKPSEVVPGVAYLVAEAFHEVGFPKGVFNMVVGLGPECGEVLAEHKDVDLVSFTGSTRAGKRISEVAARTLKPVRTELGGKSAALMLDDADLPAMVPKFMSQLMNNTGQSCNALSRMLVPRSRYEEALSICKKAAGDLKVGCSDDPSATVGPLVSKVQWERVQDYLKKGIEEGARAVIGGPGRPEGPGLDDGYFVKPTVFADVRNSMTIAQEEIFGPVLSVIPYDTEDEAVRMVNDTIYGLNNAVASIDGAKAMRVASRLRSGMVMVNSIDMDFQAPFGGYKQSGNAREWGLAGLDEFLITKTLNVPPQLYFGNASKAVGPASADASSEGTIARLRQAVDRKQLIAYCVAVLSLLWGYSARWRAARVK